MAYFDLPPPSETPPAIDNEFTVQNPSTISIEKEIWKEHAANLPKPAVLAQLEVPCAQFRFLHGGPSLSTLLAPSLIVPLSTLSGAPIVSAASSWKAFTDQEQIRLDKAWDELYFVAVSEDQKDESAKNEGNKSGGKANSILKLESKVVVGLDSLFSVDLSTLLLSSDFWDSTPVNVIKALWFYPKSSTKKIYPVDSELANKLELAYRAVEPFSESYQQELEAVLNAGTAGGDKLRTSLDLEELEVIFKSGIEGRIVSKTLVGAISKNRIGGQVVIRGWENLQQYGMEKILKEKSSFSNEVDNSTDTLPSTSTNSTKGSGFFEIVKTKIGLPAALALTDTEDTIEEVMENTAEIEIAQVDELVLVIHGIGQKLSENFGSLNFVHAVNSLRDNCTELSTDPAVAPLLGKKRAQFLPILWRQSLEFIDEEEDHDDVLDNEFTLQDIEIRDSVPLLRSVVSGLVLDVPFYLSKHREKMTSAVVRDANRVYRLFCARNPNFSGRVSVIAHSLGSALAADILSTQPTFVNPTLSNPSLGQDLEETQFAFDTRQLYLVGSPLGFFLHLKGGQLIARADRERTKNVGKDIALEKSSKYGCLAVDSVYNVYASTDPVAFCLNPTVDSSYSKIIQPIAIPSANKTLLENISTTYSRVTALLDVTTLWSTVSPSVTADIEEASSVDSWNKSKRISEEKRAKDQQALPPPTTRRPTNKRMPSQRAKPEEFAKVNRAEKRFQALNPQGSVDFVLPGEGLNEYLDAISSHAGYWYDRRFAAFILTQLFASNEILEKTGREEIALED